MQQRNASNNSKMSLDLPSSALEDITASDIEDLRAAIAEAAYYRAEKRGFEPGYDMTDWLEAEQEVSGQVA